MSQSSSFSKAEKTPYNRHFPRSFLLNYGGALQDPREEAVLKRLHDFNCEWLNRPNIALSELAQTVRENIPLLKQYRDTVLVPDFLDEYLAYFEPLKDALSRLDNKDKSTSQPPTREDVIFVLRTLDCEPDLEACIIDGLNAAGALFMLSVHLLAPLTLMRNPEDFAEKCRRTQAAQHFKEDPTSRRMRDYILNSVTKRRRLVSTAPYGIFPMMKKMITKDHNRLYDVNPDKVRDPGLEELHVAVGLKKNRVTVQVNAVHVPLLDLLYEKGVDRIHTPAQRED